MEKAIKDVKNNNENVIENENSRKKYIDEENWYLFNIDLKIETIMKKTL